MSTDIRAIFLGSDSRTMRTTQADALSQSLAEPSRRAILDALRTGQKSVGELVLLTGRKQPNISNHLAKMREQGLVRAERLGRQVYYALATPYADLVVRLHELTEAAVPASDAEIAPASSRNGKPNLSAVQQSYLAAALAGHEERVSALVSELLSERVPLETIYIAVFQKAMHIIGDLYVAGRTDEAHEHLATALTERMMAKVIQFYAPVARVSYRAVLGCVAGNWHTLGLRMLSDGLRMAGWETTYLGANVPAPSLVAMIEQVKPHLVILSCVMSEQIPTAVDLVAELKERRKELIPVFQIAAGGHALLATPEVLKQISPDFSANDLSEFMKAVRRRFPLLSPANEPA